MKYPKRLIEVDLPIKRISAHSRREKSIRHGHISTLHIWWARRPLAACRAVICASLWPDPADPDCPQSFRDAAARLMAEFAAKAYGTTALHATVSQESFGQWEGIVKAREQGIAFDTRDPAHLNKLRFALLDFIADFANWDNSTVPAYLDTARSLTLAAHKALGGEPGTRPLVVDPFAGGGSIPLEALRVGADAFASDLNPVAVLLNKVVLEYIPRYGQRLADEVRKWRDCVKEQAEKELAEFYVKDPDGATPIAYLWARTIISESPGHSEVPVEVPLLRSMWLVRKSDRKVALRWRRGTRGEILTTKEKILYADGTKRVVARPLLEVFEPKSATDVPSGTSMGGAATCPITSYTTPVERVRSQMLSRRGGAFDSRLIAIVTVTGGIRGRNYRVANDRDLHPINAARTLIDRELSTHQETSDSGGIPYGRLNHLRGYFNVVLYGMTAWGDLFNPRQLLVLLTLSRLIRSIMTSATDPGFSEAVTACISLVMGRMADANSSLAQWQVTGEKIGHTFGRQALPMVWDYSEVNPFCEATRSLDSMFDWIAKVVDREKALPRIGHAEPASATAHPLPDDSASLICTDPPYYAAVPYADLSDFFYSWLSPILRRQHPALFGDPLTPKDEECVQLSHRAAMYRHKDKNWFEATLEAAFREARRIVLPTGTGVFVFASKETAAWEAMLAALINSGWIITSSWPVDTEMGTRLRAINSATLASSIHITGRPREELGGSLRNCDVGEWSIVLDELPRRISEWMPRLDKEGISGADAIFACLGPALEIFSRYSRVEKASGEAVTLRAYLEQVWAAVAKEALSLVFHQADTSGLEPDARLTAMWLWTLSAGSSGNDGAVRSEESEDIEAEEDEEPAAGSAKVGGFSLEFDAARKIAQGLGAHLEDLRSVVEVKGKLARLLPVSERSRFLLGTDNGRASAAPGKSRKARTGLLPGMADELAEARRESGSIEEVGPLTLGVTVLDRVHQAMLMFGSGRAEAMRRFLVEDGAGNEARFWKLAQSLSALYPAGTEEKRWVDGVLARKKGLGF